MPERKRTDSDRGNTSEKKEADRRPRKKNLKARLLVSAIVVVLVAATVAVLLNIRPTGVGDVLDGAIGTPNYLKSKTINVLICGIDNEENRDELNTDVIMVVSFDLEKHAVSVLQIPRDTYVGENLVPTGKINALYNFGYKDKSVGPGINALAGTINVQLKLPIDNYITITMEGFRKAVDAVGGVEVTMTATVEMDNGIVFEEGKAYNLDGVMADKFVRYREGYATQDLERLNVQRYFMKALIEKLLGMSVMEVASMVKTINEYLESDFTVNEMIKLAMEVKKVSSESIAFVRLPGEPVAKYGQYRVDVFTLHKKETTEALNAYMRPYGDKIPETELELIELQHTISWYDDEGETLNEI